MTIQDIYSILLKRHNELPEGKTVSFKEWNTETAKQIYQFCQETLAQHSAQIGDLKNKLIKAQQEVIELKDQINAKDNHIKDLALRYKQQ